MSKQLVRISAVVPLVVAMMALSAHAFAAPTYPPSVPDSITVSSTAATAGGSITVSAKTFRAGSDVEVTTALESDAGGGSGRAGTAFVPMAVGTCATGSTCTVVADATGVATATVALTEAGPTVITLSGVDPDGEPLTQTVAVDVAAAADPDTAAAPGEDLATTGPADLLRIGLIGLGMLGAGFLLVLMVRRRRDHMGTPAPA